MAARRKRPKRKAARKARKQPARARRPSRRSPARPARPRAKAIAPAERPRPRIAATEPVPVGSVIHYFARVGSGLLALEAPLALGDWIHVRGATSDFVQAVGSLEAEGERVERAETGVVGVRLEERARPGD